ncbi:MAG: DUF882 domain-containing protein [Aquincola sp.]|nr:DUF882 domain-containing protein [Aquincola sp.]
MHTKELTTVTFRRDGRYVAEALDRLNHALRDWRNDDVIKMDPRLFDIAWEVHREVGSSSPFHVVSAYRSPGTNAMLRRRSRGVAKHSQHMQGKAMDFYLPDATSTQIRTVGMKLQRGGVGYYPTANTPFVHLDVGSVRSWPRMPTRCTRCCATRASSSTSTKAHPTRWRRCASVISSSNRGAHPTATSNG